MKARDFKGLLKAIGELSLGQKQRLKEELDGASDEAAVLSLIEGDGRAEHHCPGCNGQQLYRWGRMKGLQRYRCRACGKTFTALTGTPLARLRHRDQWLHYAHALQEGVSIRAAAMRCGIAKNTSFKWRHRFLQQPACEKAHVLQGIVEADETFFLESFKGRRHLPRPARHRGGNAAKRGTSAEQIPVLVVRDRYEQTADFRLSGTAAQDIEPILQPLLAPDAVLCTDGAAAYKIIARHAGIAHRPVNIAGGVRVLAGVYHIQNVNAYTSRLKGWMDRFHGVATRYLDNYLGWRRMLECLHADNLPLAYLALALGQHVHFQQQNAT